MGAMSRSYFFFLILATLCAALFIFLFFRHESRQGGIPVQEISTPGPKSPFSSFISGVGIVEPESDNIAIGTAVNRIVSKIEGAVGTKVKKGDVLLRLESADLEADFNSKLAAYEKSIAGYRKLEALPRPEDVASAEAVLKQAQIERDLAKRQYEMITSLKDNRAVSGQESNRRLFDLDRAEAKVQQLQADADKARLGAWKPDLEIARLEVSQFKADLEQARAELARVIVRSPIDGTVLQVKIHEGERPQTDTAKAPIMIVGNTDQLHLRVSINQFDAPYYHTGSAAVAFLQGDARREFPLEFVRLEPILVTKQNLSNEASEKVDTRVLQVVYRFKDPSPPLLVGQQMDVFIEAESF